MNRTRLFLIAVSVGVAAAAFGQQVTEPVFRSGVDLVTADVTVVDPDGRQIRGLGIDDFAVTVDGRVRTIVSAEYVSHEALPPARPAGNRGFSTNDGAPAGRLILFVVDVGNTTQLRGRAMTFSARRLVDRFTPADRVALAVLAGSGPNVEFTTDHTLVRDALGRVSGWAVPLTGRARFSLAEAIELERGQLATWNMVVERACIDTKRAEELRNFEICAADLEQQARVLLGEVRNREIASAGALAGLLGRLAGLEGPKTVILLSEGLVSTAGTGEAMRLARLASTSRSSLYVIRPEGRLVDVTEQEPRFSSNADDRLQAEGLEMLAGFARGALFSVSDDGERAFDRIASELAGYYLVAFRTEPSDRDGKPHQIRVEARRPGVKVRNRPEFRVDTEVLSRTDEELLADVLRTPTLATTLPVRLATYLLADAPGEPVRLVVSAELGQDSSREAPIAVAFTLLRPDGSTAASGFERAQLLPIDRSKPSPLQYVRTTNVPPGEYRLKLAAIDDLGRRGSVEHTVIALPLQMGSLVVGDLFLADASTAQSGLRPAANVAVGSANLQTALSVHAADVAELGRLRILMEIAESEDGPALASADARLAAGDRVDMRNRLAQVAVPLPTLTAGRYLARAVLSLEGERIGRVIRPFDLTVDLWPARSSTASERPATVVSPAAAAASLLRPAPFRAADVLEPAVVGLALDRLTTSTAPTKRSPRVTAALGQARAGRFEDLAGALEGAPLDSAETAFLRGLALYAKGELNPAANAFKAALRQDPELLPALLYLGACYAAAGQDREAAGAWQTLMVDDATPPDVYRLTADALLRQGEADAAAALLDEAVTRWPGTPGLANRLSLARARAGHPAEALAGLVPIVEGTEAGPDDLLLALRLLYELRSGGRAFETPADDADRFRKYAARYAETNGPHGALVARWQKAVAP
jgi:VWFA-related protein